jgi:hypothetical protein
MTRGRRPKAPHLRLVQGTHRPDRHGDASTVKAQSTKSAGSFGPLVRPTYLKGHARAAWDRFVVPAYWLDASREPAAVAFCELWQELRLAPTRFVASRHSQLRAYLADLGLTDERRRAVDEPAVRDEFFDE